MDKEGSPYPSQKNFHDFIGWRGRKKGSKRKGKQAKRGNKCGRPSVAPTKSIPDEVQTLIGYFDIIACADYRKPFSLIGETVCLPDVFSLTRKYFYFWFAMGDTFHSALICASYCLTFAPETREKGWRNRVHTNVGALCAVERANAVKAPSSLKVKTTDTAPHLSDDKSISVAH